MPYQTTTLVPNSPIVTTLALYALQNFTFSATNYTKGQIIYDPATVKSILADSVAPNYVDQANINNAVIIPSGQSVSNVFYIPPNTNLNVVSIPSSWTAANLTFLLSQDGVTFREIYDALGNEYTVTAAANRSIFVDAALFTNTIYLQVQSGVTATPVAQAASRLLYFSMS
jgi:hypothetical protein